MQPFIIPEGDHSEEFTRYENLMRIAMLNAGRRRQRFIEYKKAVKRCHINSVETEATRELLKQVNSSQVTLMKK